MGKGPQHEIANLKSVPGELSFDAKLSGETHRVWMRSETPVTSNADAALASCLLPAMALGGTLRMEDPVSPRILRTQREYQAVQEAWSRDWDFAAPRKVIELEAPARAVEIRQPTGRVAAFFSGGVDSWSMILANPDITDLVFVRGFDLAIGGSAEVLGGQVEERLQDAADEVGLTLHVVNTNLRQMTDPLAVWDSFYGSAVSAVALFLGDLFDRVLIAGDSDYEVQVRLGANWLVDQLWSREGLEIVNAGGRRSRMERLALIASHPTVQRTLRVCRETRDFAYNCGRCSKCLGTMAGLEAVGALRDVETFPSELDFYAVAAIEVKAAVSIARWEEILDAARREGHDELERAIATLAARGRERLGMSWDWRRRRRPGPRPTAAGSSVERLLTTPETAEAIERADSIAFLVGGYDGSGNFGDMALLDAASSLLSGPEGPSLLLPVIELGAAETHAESQQGMLHEPEHVVLYEADAQSNPGLVPVPAPVRASFAVCYLYGGGYLNRRWGERKLQMLGAAEAALRAAGATRVLRISSSLQAEPAWLETATVSDRARLRLFEPLGARDRRSLQALDGLGAAEAQETGDDAVAVLCDLPTGPLGVESDRLRVNVHYAPHDWATERPQPLRELLADLLAELGRTAAQPVVVRPLVAYLDRRVGESCAAAELAAACAARGIEIEEAIALRPASLAGSARELRRARLTIACSYHAALTSLMLQIPTVPVCDTPYYEQKMAGLREDFELPDDWTLSSTESVDRAGAKIGREILDPPTMAVHSERLAEARARVVRRRAATEDLLAERLAAARAERSLLPAFLSERRDGERRVAMAEDLAAEADRRAAAAEAELAPLLSAQSWRFTAPLRELPARLPARRT
jgi:polysaccharide pyruvyl transferase WcaK-like protein